MKAKERKRGEAQNEGEKLRECGCVSLIERQKDTQTEGQTYLNVESVRLAL